MDTKSELNQIIYQVGCENCPKSGALTDISFKHFITLRESFIHNEPVVCKHCKSVYHMTAMRVLGEIQGVGQVGEVYRISVELCPMRIPKNLMVPIGTFNGTVDEAENQDEE